MTCLKTLMPCEVIDDLLRHVKGAPMSTADRKPYKGAVVQQRTEKRIGSTLRATEVAELTGVSRSAVQKAKTAGKVFAFRSPGIRHDLFPVLQFKGAEVREWVEPLLAATGQGSAALHFLTVNRHSLDGRSYAEILRKTPRNSNVITAMLAQAIRIGNPGA